MLPEVHLEEVLICLTSYGILVVKHWKCAVSCVLSCLLALIGCLAISASLLRHFEATIRCTGFQQTLPKQLTCAVVFQRKGSLPVFPSRTAVALASTHWRIRSKAGAGPMYPQKHGTSSLETARLSFQRIWHIWPPAFRYFESVGACGYLESSWQAFKLRDKQARTW